jgi:pimeloyl-ACP methyl ester carboxylesterase
MTLSRTIPIILITVTILYLFLCTILFFFQRSLIYFPQPASNRDAPTITLPVPDARVLVSTRPKNAPRAVLYFGGNAEDVSLSVPAFSDAFPDAALYLLHYRGYGGSSGAPSEAALVADALTLFDYAHASHPNITVIGRSLGSGVAVYVASRRPVERLVLVTPFDSLQDIAAAQYPFIPVRWFLRDKFESWRYAPNVTAPTRIIAAAGDEIIPRESTNLLLSRFKPGQASLTVLPGTGHNTISFSPRYLPLLTSAPEPY